MIRPGILIALLGSLLASEANAPRLSADMPWNNSEGYSPVVLTVTAPRDTKLQLDIDGSTSSASTTLVLAAGETRRFTLLLPAESNPWNVTTLTWRSAGGGEGELQVSPNHRHREIAVALIGDEASLPMAPWTKALAGMSWSRHTYSSTTDVVHRLAIDQLPDRWQGYPTWLTLVVDGASQARLSPSQREAIAAWTLAGGLLVLPDGRQANAWRQLGAIVHVSGDPEHDALIERHVASARDQANDPGQREELPGSQRVPATGFMIVALCFALLVGPVNLLWVKRRNARHLFLLTTPLLSLATCIILLGADLLLHGLALRRQVRQLVVLDQLSHRAAAWTLVTATSGFALSTLDLDPETEAFRLDAQWPQDSYRGYSPRRRHGNLRFRLHWGDRQTASGTWGTARTPTTIRYRQVLPQRARVEVRRIDDTLHVVNGLGVDLRNVMVHGANRTWEIDSLAAGASAVLDQPFPGEPGRERLEAFDAVAERAAAPLPGGWWLLADSAEPLAPVSGPSGIDLAPPTSVLFARLADPSGAAP